MKQNRDPPDRGRISCMLHDIRGLCGRLGHQEHLLSVSKSRSACICVYSILNQNINTYMSGLNGFLFPEYLFWSEFDLELLEVSVKQ